LSNIASRSVLVIPVNDAPVVDLDNTTAGNDSTATFTEDGGAVSFAPNAAITDVDSTNLTSATITLTNHPDGAAEALGVTTTGTSITAGAYNATTGVLSLTGTDTVAHYQAVIRTLTYNNSSQNPTTTSRSVTVVVSDGTDSSVTRTATITVTPVNDAPVLANIETTALGYTENDPATVITSTLTVSDVDSANLTGATVTLSSGYHSAEDVLSFTDTATITGSWDSTTGVLTLSGTDTLAHYQAALRSVKYSNTSDNPSSATRTASFQVDDGSSVNNLSNVATRNITVTPVNDAPVLANIETTALGYTENDPATVITSTLTVSDVDSANLTGATVTLSSGYHSAEDVLSFTDTATITG